MSALVWYACKLFTHPTPCRTYKSTVGFVTSYVWQEILAKMSTEDLSFVLKGVGMDKAGHRYDSLPRCSSSR